MSKNILYKNKLYNLQTITKILSKILLIIFKMHMNYFIPSCYVLLKLILKIQSSIRFIQNKLSCKMLSINFVPLNFSSNYGQKNTKMRINATVLKYVQIFPFSRGPSKNLLNQKMSEGTSRCDL